MFPGSLIDHPEAVHRTEDIGGCRASRCGGSPSRDMDASCCSSRPFVHPPSAFAYKSAPNTAITVPRSADRNS